MTAPGDPRTTPGNAWDHVKAAMDELAIAMAKAMAGGVRIPDGAYAANSSLTPWEAGPREFAGS